MRKIEAHWRAELGCAWDVLPRGVTVIVHGAALAAYSGVYAVMREDRCVVSAPARVVDRARDALAGRAAADVFDARAIAVPFADAVERVIGPRHRSSQGPSSPARGRRRPPPARRTSGVRYLPATSGER